MEATKTKPNKNQSVQQQKPDLPKCRVCGAAMKVHRTLKQKTEDGTRLSITRVGRCLGKNMHQYALDKKTVDL